MDPVLVPRGLGRQSCRGPQGAHGCYDDYDVTFTQAPKHGVCLVVSMGEVQASNIHALILGDLLFGLSCTSC